MAEGDEHKHFLGAGPRGCDEALVPPEMGGKGGSLDGDGFLAAAVEWYDGTATRPRVVHLDAPS